MRYNSGDIQYICNRERERGMVFFRQMPPIALNPPVPPNALVPTPHYHPTPTPTYINQMESKYCLEDTNVSMATFTLMNKTHLTSENTLCKTSFTKSALYLYVYICIFISINISIWSVLFPWGRNHLVIMMTPYIYFLHYSPFIKKRV